MKVSKEHYKKILNAFKSNIEDIKQHVEYLKNNKQLYNNYEVRLIWDCLHAVKIIHDINTINKCEFTYTDNHLETAGRKALKELCILV